MDSLSYEIYTIGNDNPENLLDFIYTEESARTESLQSIMLLKYIIALQ